MKTYQVTYWPPVSDGVTIVPPSVTVTLQAADIMVNDNFLMLVDTTNAAVFFIPVSLHPVVTLIP